MDLTKHAPRSVYDTLGGMRFLPRAIDKMRAEIAGTSGEYNARTGFGTRLFDLLGVDADGFEAIVRAHDTDEGVLQGLLAHKHPSVEAVAAFNHQVESWPEGNPEAQERHRTMLEKAGFGHRTDIVTMADRLDLDDGREVPNGGHLGKGLAKH